MRYCKVFDVFRVLRFVFHGQGEVRGLNRIICLKEYFYIPVAMEPEAGPGPAVYANQ